MFKKFLEIGNRYAQNSNWTDFALTKLCLCALGVLIGLYLPITVKTAATVIAAAVFIITYMILMGKLLRMFKK